MEAEKRSCEVLKRSSCDTLERRKQPNNVGCPSASLAKLEFNKSQNIELHTETFITETQTSPSEIFNYLVLICKDLNEVIKL